MKQILSLVVVAIFLVSISCAPPITGSAGSLTVSFSPSGIANRTILPDTDMTIAGYVVSGSGPEGASFQVETTGTTVSVNKLTFGDWTVTVEAKNGDDIIIGSGTGTTTVHTGESSLVSITVVPLTGLGTLDLTVTWNAADTDIPSIDAKLIPAVGSELILDFSDPDSGSSTYNAENIPTGYHTLIVKLLDNGLLTMGAVEVVRIVNGGVSTGVFEFLEINQPGGTIEVNITPELGDPLTVSIDGVVAELPQGDSMTVTANVAESVGNVAYVWYLNGDAIGTGQSISLGSGLEVGFHGNLSVTAMTTDGSRAGSANAEFMVVEAAAP